MMTKHNQDLASRLQAYEQLVSTTMRPAVRMPNQS